MHYTTAYARQKRKSLAVLELLSGSVDLLTYLHDRLLEQPLSSSSQLPRLERLLGFLETSETFLELAAAFAGGDVARWIVIAAVQVAKSVVGTTASYVGTYAHNAPKCGLSGLS